MTTAQENAQLASEYFSAVMNDNEFKEALLSTDYKVHSGSDTVSSLDEIKANIEMAHKAFPDLNVNLEDVIATDEDVVIRYRLTGTHDGPFMGIEPTGEEINQVGFIQFKIEDGKIIEAWNLSDQFALFAELGVIEPPNQ